VWLAVMLSACAPVAPLLQRLHAVKGLSEAKADKMVEAAKKLTTAGSWISGAEAMQKVRHEVQPAPGQASQAGCCSAETVIRHFQLLHACKTQGDAP
jgi:hypothetical protein